MIREYHNHKLQTNPWHCEEEPHNLHETPRRQTKQYWSGSLENHRATKQAFNVGPSSARQGTPCKLRFAGGSMMASL